MFSHERIILYQVRLKNAILSSKKSFMTESIKSSISCRNSSKSIWTLVDLFVIIEKNDCCINARRISADGTNSSFLSNKEH